MYLRHVTLALLLRVVLSERPGASSSSDSEDRHTDRSDVVQAPRLQSGGGGGALRLAVFRRKRGGRSSSFVGLTRLHSRGGAGGRDAKGGTSACSEGMVLAPFFTTHEDWQRHVFVRAAKSNVEGLLNSTGRLGLCVTFVYDALPDSLIQSISSDRVRFERVDLKAFGERLSPNDSRFLVFEKLLNDHPEWPKAFLVDAFDVRAAMDPFPHMEDRELYVCSEDSLLATNSFMHSRFQEMGGKYLDWYGGADPSWKTVNAGVVGGSRGELLDFLGQMRAVLTDPKLAAWKSGGDVHVNMGALNYVVYANYPPEKVKAGDPVTSKFRGFQEDRKDVWFIHK